MGNDKVAATPDSKRFIRFLLRQGREIREGGLQALLRKSYTLLAMALAALVVLAVRVLRPLILIRFGPLRSERIGHFAGDTELYLCERDAGMHGSRTLDIFYQSSPVCNQQLKKMWDRTLHVSRFARSLARVNRWLPGYEAHVIPMPSDKDPHGLLLGRMQAHLSFTPEEEELGRAGLLNLGIPEGAPFVCFHSRDAAYLNEVFPDRNWRYHDYRDSSIRNCIPAAEELVCRGYFAVRMGMIVKEALKITNPRIIDYATNGRTDFLDIFLCARCRFFLGAAGGLNAIPRIFRRPLAFTNVVPLGRDLLLGHCGPNNLFIPKKLWLCESGRFLTFREILQFGADQFWGTEQYEQLGVEVVGNTPEEITTLVIEMDKRLLGTWRTTEEDEELQQRFWSLFDLNHMCDNKLLRIGAEFLRQNRKLLE